MPRRLTGLYLILTILFFLLAVVHVAEIVKEIRHTSAPELHITVPVAPNIEHTHAVPMARVIYGHAVIPGGVHSVFQALAAYPSLRASQTQFSTLPFSVFAHVSYVRDGHVYFTKRLRLIPAGEPIITDGSTIILVKCGNQLSFTDPRPEDTDPMPEPTDLDQPVGVIDAPYVPTSLYDVSLPTPDAPTAPVVLNDQSTITSCCVAPPPPGAPVFPASEPSTVLMLAFGFLVLMLIPVLSKILLGRGL